jgi:hypothetical protein
MPHGKGNIEMNKQDLIDRQDLVDLIVARGAATRQQLLRKSDEELVKILDDSLLADIRAEAAQAPQIVARQREADQINEDRLWTRFFFKHPEITDVAANRKMIFDYALSLSYDGVVTFENLAEAAKAKLSGLDRQKVKQVPTAANLKQDEKTLQEYCRANRLEPNTAALNLLRQEFGAGFSSAQIDKTLQSRLIAFDPASDEHVLQWTREEAEERQDYLINQASPEELRATAKAEAEQRRIQAQREEAERQIAAREQMDAVYGFPPLPEFNSAGEKIDAAYLNKISNTNLQLFKNLMRKHGAANLTARLRGIR